MVFPMTLSMYSASVPVFSRMLKNLLAVFEKAEAFAAEQNIDPVEQLALAHQIAVLRGHLLRVA